MGEDGDVEMGIIWKLDLKDLRFLLGRYNIHLSDIRDGQLGAQLPFLAFGILHQLGAWWVELILAYCQSLVLSTSFLRKTLAGIVGTQPLDWWLEKKLHSAKILG